MARSSLSGIDRAALIPTGHRQRIAGPERQFRQRQRHRRHRLSTFILISQTRAARISEHRNPRAAS